MNRAFFITDFVIFIKQPLRLFYLYTIHLIQVSFSVPKIHFLKLPKTPSAKTNLDYWP